MIWEITYPNNCEECAYLKVSANKEDGFIPKPIGCFYAFNKYFDLKEFNPYEERPKWCPLNEN